MNLIQKLKMKLFFYTLIIKQILINFLRNIINKISFK